MQTNVQQKTPKTPTRFAQYGTGHGHAGGKAAAMLSSRDVELVGVFEPDPAAREMARSSPVFAEVRWLDSSEQLLGDPSIVAVAVEGRNDQSLAMAREAARAGKHLWYDKPAGDDWSGYLGFLDEVRQGGLHLQMGYMFRYHDGFRMIAEWARSGLLGDVFAVRAHMSTWIPTRTAEATWSASFTREAVSRYRGGIFYDLAGHMLDQLVWIMGRPSRVGSFFRNDATPELPAFADNTVCVFEFDRGIGIVDIAAMEARPAARRFEVFGTRGSALLEPFEPATEVRLHLEEPAAGFARGDSVVPLAVQTRQELYERELAAFVARLRGERESDRTLEHEALVQETLLRATGGAPGS